MSEQPSNGAIMFAMSCFLPDDDEGRAASIALGVAAHAALQAGWSDEQAATGFSVALEEMRRVRAAADAPGGVQ